MRINKNKLPDDLYDWLFVSGIVPGTFNGLPKVHKPGCPIRPILSAINTFNYNLGKFLVPVLAPLTSNEYTVKMILIVLPRISRLLVYNIPFYMASFDVKCLLRTFLQSKTLISV